MNGPVRWHFGGLSHILQMFDSISGLHPRIPMVPIPVFVQIKLSPARFYYLLRARDCSRCWKKSLKRQNMLVIIEFSWGGAGRWVERVHRLRKGNKVSGEPLTGSDQSLSLRDCVSLFYAVLGITPWDIQMWGKRSMHELNAGTLAS